MSIRGHAHKFGANVDTDVIIPARYLNINEPAELAKHAMEGVDPGFARRVRPGDIIVAGANFGGGSSREHAPLALKAAGIGCIIAPTFARIFYRSALNIGLPVLECAQAEAIQEGDLLEIELTTGDIQDLSQALPLRAQPYPPFMLELLAAGGLVEFTRRRLAGRKG